MLRVLLVDDHRSYTDLLALGLAVHGDAEVVGVAHDAAAARAALAGADPRRAPQVVVLDVRLPGGGLTLLGDVHAAGARALVLTAHPRPGPAREALEAGAAGFLGKQTPLSGIVAAVRTVAAGGTAHPPAAASEPTGATLPRLTPRELDVLRGLAGGRDVTRIAAAHRLSPHTVRDHVRALLGKLGARSQLEAVVAAERLGLVALDPGGEPVPRAAGQPVP
ncbi:response regulator transcription factor [Pseudonocardia alni]|uniref:Two-component system response regulator DesR n=1 Tax=Pseudonocardia alni TaxID=33907 RepID=A0A852W296_PSEA5|nr:response regulator transcription factor [Pseudonocardia antarctica]NYG00076.1 two-component system response regulator DesR [Pseudonocardia antarctica]